MFVRRILAMTAAAALASAAAGAAHAADKPAKPMDFTVRAEPAAAIPNSGQVVKWDARKGRFGFTLDMQQPVTREATPNDVKAGAYYRITPSLRVGGSVAFGEQELAPRPNQVRPADQPRVRLESTFKF